MGGLNGYLKLHRKLLDWEWYSDKNVRMLWIHLLLTANFKPGKWRGIDIKKGQLITGRVRLADETGLTQQEVRTALNKLKSTGEITIETTKGLSLVTVVNWEEYNGFDESSTSSSTSISTTEQPEINQQSTSDQPQRKNNKKDNKDNITPPNPPKWKRDEMFEKFWQAYPKKKSKGAARTAFAKISFEQFDAIMAGIERAKTSIDWRQDNGRYIPHPSTWLNAEGWLDEVEKADDDDDCYKLFDFTEYDDDD